MKRGLFISLIALASLTALPAVAAPQAVEFDRAPASIGMPSVKSERVMPLRHVQRQISPSEAKSIALRRVSGKVVDIRKVRDTYRVRIIRTDGRVVDVVVDANTGRVR